MHWAEQFNKQTDLNEGLIKAYFEDGFDISNLDVLLDIALQVGLDRVKAETALSFETLALELGRKTRKQRSFNIQSIPAFILNENTAISGSQTVGFFEKTLSEFIDEGTSKAKIAS